MYTFKEVIELKRDLWTEIKLWQLISLFLAVSLIISLI
jgi:hypothetical protein